jgi:hypothetical protein
MYLRLGAENARCRVTGGYIYLNIVVHSANKCTEIAPVPQVFILLKSRIFDVVRLNLQSAGKERNWSLSLNCPDMKTRSDHVLYGPCRPVVLEFLNLIDSRQSYL